VHVETRMSAEHMKSPDGNPDPQLVPLSSHRGSALDSACIGAHGSGSGTICKGAMNRTVYEWQRCEWGEIVVLTSVLTPSTSL
jgi:hypothetical protein